MSAVYCLHRKIPISYSTSKRPLQKQSLSTANVHSDDWPVGLKHVGVCGFYNIALNRIQFRATVGLNYNKTDRVRRNHSVKFGVETIRISCYYLLINI